MVFLQKCLSQVLQSNVARDIELWHVQRAKTLNLFISNGKIILTVSPLDTPRQSLGTRGDRSRAKQKILTHKRANKVKKFIKSIR